MLQFVGSQFMTELTDLPPPLPTKNKNMDDLVFILKDFFFKFSSEG